MVGGFYGVPMYVDLMVCDMCVHVFLSYHHSWFPLSSLMKAVQLLLSNQTSFSVEALQSDVSLYL